MKILHFGAYVLVGETENKQDTQTKGVVYLIAINREGGYSCSQVQMRLVC